MVSLRDNDALHRSVLESSHYYMPRKPSQRQSVKASTSISSTFTATIVSISRVFVVFGLFLLVWFLCLHVEQDDWQVKQLAPENEHSIIDNLIAQKKPAATTSHPLDSAARLAKPDSDTVVIATPLKDVSETLDDFFRGVLALRYPLDKVSLILLESDCTDNGATISKLAQWMPVLSKVLKRVVIGKHDFNYKLSGPKHDLKLQASRRSVLSKSRNLLLEVGMHEEDWVLWIDADIIRFDPGVIERFLAVEEDIVVPNVKYGLRNQTYDLNSWYELRPDWVFSDNSSVPTALFEGYNEVYGEVFGDRLFLPDFEYNSSFPDLVPLHGVGSAFLWVNANAHRQGLIFPEKPYKRRLESEGLGLMALDMGIQPWALPRLNVIHKSKQKRKVPEVFLAIFIAPFVVYLVLLCRPVKSLFMGIISWPETSSSSYVPTPLEMGELLNEDFTTASRRAFLSQLRILQLRLSLGANKYLVSPSLTANSVSNPAEVGLGSSNSVGTPTMSYMKTLSSQHDSLDAVCEATDRLQASPRVPMNNAALGRRNSVTRVSGDVDRAHFHESFA